MRHSYMYAAHIHAHNIHTHSHTHTYLFHVTMEISVHSVENIPRYTADTVGTV